MKTPVSFFVILRFVLVATFATSVMAQADTNKIASAPSHATTALANDAPDLPQPPSSTSHFSRWISEIVRLTQSGVDDQVMLAFIENAGVFNLAAADIAYLNDLGVSSHVVHSMLIHDRDHFAQLGQPTNVANSSALIRQPLVIASRDKLPQIEIQSVSSSLPVTAIPSMAVTSDDSATQNFNSTAAAQAATTKPDSLNWEKPTRLPTVSTKKKIVYPVREPYPVELTAPIVMLEFPPF